MIDIEVKRFDSSEGNVFKYVFTGKLRTKI